MSSGIEISGCLGIATIHQLSGEIRLDCASKVEASLDHSSRTSRTNSRLIAVIGSMVFLLLLQLIGLSNHLALLHHMRAHSGSHFVL